MLFALVGTAAIVLLSSIGVPRPDDELDVDRHTGARHRAVRTVGDALAEARRTGNAREALERVRKRRKQFPQSDVLRGLEAALLAEVGPPDADVPLHHPFAGGIEAERALALRAREEFTTRARAYEAFSPAGAVALLARLEADEAIARSTEGLFAKLGIWNADAPPAANRPDEMVARVQLYLEQTAPIEEDAELFLALIRAFRTENRPRARLRWSLNAFASLPGSRRITDELIAAYLERGDVLEAFVVVGAALQASPDDVELWRMRARFAGWQSLPHAELEARENLLRFEKKREHHERIVVLCDEVGDPARAVPHAEELAKGSTDKRVLLGPVLLALDAGDTDRALALLAKRAETSDDPAWWREKIIHYASQDMRADRVVSELDWLRKRYPDRDYEQRLEGILRRRGRHGELADLLEERLERKPEDRELEQELIQLRYALGHEEKALALLRRRMEREDDPVAFFHALPTYRALGIPGVRERAQALAASPRITAETAPAILLDLEPLTADDAAYLPIATGIARRHPRVPEVREFLIRISDRAANDAGRAVGAAKLAAEHPDDEGYVRAWAERAAWAGDLKGETAAREQLAKLQPGDLDNRRSLADLYDAQNLPEKSLVQWRVVAAAEGIESPAQLRLVDALLSTERLDEAMAILEKRATLPGATLEDQLFVGEELFGKTHWDRALRFYDAVLAHDPNHPLALLREGQIKAWSNDPRGAIPLLERRLTVTQEDAPAVQFILGECHWAIGESKQARRIQEPALAALSAEPDRTIEQDVMVAKMLARFGRHDEARPLFDHVIATRPDDADLLLDYAESMMAIEDYDRARPLVDEARNKRPQYARALRADGKLALLEKRYEASARLLAESVERYGHDAGTESELGRALQLAGDYRGSLAAYRAANALQPDNHDLDEELRVMEDQLSRLLHANAELRKVASDTALQGWLAGSMLVQKGRTRVGGLLGYAHYAGPAAAVDNGRTDVTTDIFRADVAVTHRVRRRHEIGGGLQTFAGANGNTPVALWLGANFFGERPTWNVALRGWWNELFADPAAAAGLGGRSTGAFAQGECDVGERFWVGGSVRYESLSLDFEGQNPADPRFVGVATLGWRVLEGPTRVAGPHRIGRARMPGIVGAMLGEDLGTRRRSMLSAWINAATLPRPRRCGDHAADPARQTVRLRDPRRALRPPAHRHVGPDGRRLRRPRAARAGVGVRAARRAGLATQGFVRDVSRGRVRKRARTLELGSDVPSAAGADLALVAQDDDERAQEEAPRRDADRARSRPGRRPRGVRSRRARGACARGEPAAGRHRHVARAARRHVDRVRARARDRSRAATRSRTGGRPRRRDPYGPPHRTPRPPCARPRHW